MTRGTSRLVAAAALSVLMGTLALGQDAWDAEAARYEAALRAAPDDLRAGNDYRLAVIAAAKDDRTLEKYDRAIAFFEELVAEHPEAANAHLNHGFAYVDKIPAAGAITQVILANNALTAFGKSIELRPTWIGLYTRGNSYLFWPRIFDRTKYGVADLEAAMEVQKKDRHRAYYVRTYVALGDGYWMMDDLPRAIATWKDGLAQFPGSRPLEDRLAAEGAALEALIDAAYDPSQRVDTSLEDLWSQE